MVYTPTQKQDTFGPEFYADRQKMFDYIVDRMVEQGEPSAHHGTCAYTHRKEDGKILHCGVGHILPAYILAGITDHDRNTKGDDYWNHQGFDQLVASLDKAQVSLPFPDRDKSIKSDWYRLSRFLGGIQSAHDRASAECDEEFLPNFFRAMYNVAYTYQLDTFSLDHYRLSLGISLI